MKLMNYDFSMNTADYEALRPLDLNGVPSAPKILDALNKLFSIRSLVCEISMMPVVI